jgi:hypothetical protein
MTGIEVISATSAIEFNNRSSYGTRSTYYTGSNIIHGGEDNASYLGANIQIGTWYGFGIYSTQNSSRYGKNTFWHDARTGNTYTWGTYYKFNGTNYTEVSYNGHNHDDRYVTALGTSGDNVTWTKNGTDNSLTVPYSTKTGYFACKGCLTSQNDYNNLEDGLWTQVNGNRPANTPGSDNDVLL